MSFAGIVGTGLSAGILALTDTQGTMRVKRRIGDLVANVTVEENGVDELAITQHPVEKTADITDHAFMLPSTLTIRVGYSPAGASPNGIIDNVVNAFTNLFGNNDPVSLQSIYQQYLDLQSSRQLIEVQTGKRLYKDMLIKSIAVVTDLDSENALFMTLQLQKVILVETQTVTVPSNAVQKDPSKTGNQLNGGVKNAIPKPSLKISGLA